MEIQKLDFVNVRDIWRNEARDFTVWLAKNIDYLNEQLEFNVNVLETEKQVGSFNVDLFGEDDAGNNVIIENQLEKTDHTHLGQLLTYAVGVQAKTVIWISTEPRTEHVEVIQWLNETTPVDMSWYLFKLQAVRISDSPVSPLFTKVVGPSREVKTLGSEIKNLAERHEKRLEFWRELLSVLNQKTSTYRNISPSRDNWLNAGTGVGGIYYCLIIREHNASIQLVLDKKRELNKRLFDFFHEQCSVIESRFGHDINWRRMDEQISSRIQFDLDSVGLADKNSWTLGVELLSEKFVAWEQTFHPYINEARKVVVEDRL